MRPAALLADDETPIGVLVQEALEDAGYSVVSTGSGVEALARLEGGDSFMALVTDINFWRTGGGLGRRHPGRPDGPSVAIVCMTGDSAHDWRAQGVPQSVVITKPFTPSQIVVALSSLLNRNDGAA